MPPRGTTARFAAYARFNPREHTLAQPMPVRLLMQHLDLCHSDARDTVDAPPGPESFGLRHLLSPSFFQEHASWVA